MTTRITASSLLAPIDQHGACAAPANRQCAVVWSKFLTD